MTRLVALDLPGGPAFLHALRTAWDEGDAVLAVDQRLPEAAREALLAHARPHAIVTADGTVVPHEPDAPLLEHGDRLVAATSGSTGRPALVVHTESSLIAHAVAVHERLAVDPDRDRWLACLPLNHLGGFGVVARSVLTGTPVDLLPRFDAAAVAAAPAALGTTLVSLVPTALDRVDPAAFRAVVLGGSADLHDRPGNVVRTYGLTESGGGVVYDGTPLPGTEVRVDHDGTIWLRGATIGRGRRHPDGAVTPLVGPDGWLATGDLGRWVDGRLVVAGRADDLIVTGGENVWPEPVEAVLRALPGIGEVAVVGVPDDEWGQRVVAVVVAAEGASLPTLDEARAAVLDVLPAAAAPRELRVVAALPRTALGKVRRGVLAGGADA